jgi:GH35 family endo-1,4-beta-xylanase
MVVAARAAPRGRHHRGCLPLGAPGRSARTALYNDYNISGEDGANAKGDAVFAWLKQMLVQGVPINGVGDQGHLDTQYGFWVPGFFTGEGYATIYDVNLNPKPAYTELQQDLRLAASGAPHRPPTEAGL